MATVIFATLVAAIAIHNSAVHLNENRFQLSEIDLSTNFRREVQPLKKFCAPLKMVNGGQRFSFFAIVITIISLYFILSLH